MNDFHSLLLFGRNKKYFYDIYCSRES